MENNLQTYAQFAVDVDGHSNNPIMHVILLQFNRIVDSVVEAVDVLWIIVMRVMEEELSLFPHQQLNAKDVQVQEDNLQKVVQYVLVVVGLSELLE